MRVDQIIYNAGQLVTCASQAGPKKVLKKGPKKGVEMGESGIVENGAVAIKDGLIVAAGPSQDVMRDHEAGNTIDAKGNVVMPGFVECHTHLVYGGHRLNEFELRIRGASYLEIMEAGGGIVSTMRHTREASVAELMAGAGKRLGQMLALGVTTCEVKTGYGLDTETELKMLHVIEELDRTHPVNVIPTFLAAHAFPPEYKEKPDDYVSLVCKEMIPLAAKWYAASHFAEKGTPFFIDVFCEKNAFTLEQSERVLEAGKSYGMKIKAHVDEFTNLGGARFAIENAATSIDHLDAISDEEIALLASSETIGVVTPTVNFNLGNTEFADARKMIDAGCAIALSTDFNPGSAPCPSLPGAMAIACRYQKLSPAEALNAATINAAFAVGLGNKIGSIEAGKQADLLILDISDYRQLAYEFGGNPIDQVIKTGQSVYQASV
ncbi:MAG TPA: imidazolonepropionase [Pyrinomonadaceae bacterium]|jgi:imidazolonepropionase|nr:imidazolonepropionase [Pyrinomonadaceae bacterium]